MPTVMGVTLVGAPGPPDWKLARLCRKSTWYCGGTLSEMEKWYALGLILGLQTIAAMADTPQEAWKKAIADQNARCSSRVA